MKPTKSRRTSAALAGVAASALLLAACSSGGEESGGGGDAEPIDAEEVADEGGELLVWGWGNAMEPMVDGFMEAYPNVDIELVNVAHRNRGCR